MDTDTLYCLQKRWQVILSAHGGTSMESVRLKRNNFDLLRLAFAATVCCVHAYELSGAPELSWVGKWLSSKVAIEGFFVVSGFLIFMSYEKAVSNYTYAGKRFRRIYPAYFTVVILCAIFLWIVGAKPLDQYFSKDWLKYVFSNLVFLNFLHHDLPGVFQNNRWTAVNGALWTLKIEVMFYASVPLIVYLIRRLGRLPVLLTLYSVSVGYAVILQHLGNETGSPLYFVLARQLPGQLSYFLSGAFFYYYLPVFERRWKSFLVCALLILAADKWWMPDPLLSPFGIAVVVVFCGLYGYVGNFGKYGDFSYGVYILHFPILQIFISAGRFVRTPMLDLLMVIGIVILSAALMWHLVEKRFLLRTSHYITVMQTEAP